MNYTEIPQQLEPMINPGLDYLPGLDAGVALAIAVWCLRELWRSRQRDEDHDQALLKQLVDNLLSQNKELSDRVDQLEARCACHAKN